MSVHTHMHTHTHSTHTHTHTHTPPCTFTRLGSMSINLMLANTTTEKASLISQRAMSSFLNPHCSRTLLMAATGAVGKSMGASAASPNPGEGVGGEG